jgi:LPPG:FO 2-phospho-L-lactate transferase
VPTWVCTRDEGELPFQDYFVRRQCQPLVEGFRFAGAELAQPAPGVLEALQTADRIVICPSNPWVSIAPILSIPGIKNALRERAIVAISPIIAGQTVKGPAAKMYAELGIQPSALAVARHYTELLAQVIYPLGFVMDTRDADQVGEVEALGMQVLATNTLMKSAQDRARLAKEVLSL